MAKFRFRTFCSARRAEKKARERAESRSEKDFKAGKTINPYRGANQRWAWEKRFVSLTSFFNKTKIDTTEI